VRIWNFESRLKTDSAEFSSTGTEGVLLEAVLISFLMLERVNGMQAILCAGHFFVFFGKFNGGRSASARFGGAVCHVPPRSLSRNRPVARNAVRCSLFRIESVARRLHRGNDQARRLPLADRIEQRDFVALIMLLKAREVMPLVAGRMRTIFRKFCQVSGAVPPKVRPTLLHLYPGRDEETPAHEELHFVFFVSTR